MVTASDVASDTDNYYTESPQAPLASSQVSHSLQSPGTVPPSLPTMAGPVYNTVWLLLCTLHPAYASFKAVKNKNVKEYVKWMMYWIVFALFSATECVLDPLVAFWLPFYSEMKVLLLLYLASPATRGSGVVYRRWVHPLLCSKEEEIDRVLERVKEQGYNTVQAWVHQGVQWMGGMLVTTAIRGGGGLVQQLKRSCSLTDLTERDWREEREDRFTDVTEEEEGPYSPSPYSTPGLRRKYIRSQENIHQAEQNRGQGILHPSRILSTESLSSGYNTDQFHPVNTDTMDTEDYELWERRRPVTEAQSNKNSSGVPRSRKVIRTRAQVLQRSVSDDEDDTFYESLQTPFGQTLPHSHSYHRQLHVQSPDSSCYPSDRESTVGDYSDCDLDDMKSDIVENSEVCKDPLNYGRPGHIPHQADDGDMTPIEREASLTVEELQIAARKLNLCLVTPAHDDQNAPTPPRRTQRADQNRELAGFGQNRTEEMLFVGKGKILYQNPGYPSQQNTAQFTAGYLTPQAVATRRNYEEREGIENICDAEVTALETSDECILITSTDCTTYYTDLNT
eukprot:GFUD01043636.1.p1 GENE.GFUD01043636.1~~GFUD01043636.1.p1  ORF type:complete len:564 (+),score=181.50 GFUD01043636.1:27-1718(+)